jgi:YHS domain-containing protein
MKNLIQTIVQAAAMGAFSTVIAFAAGPDVNTTIGMTAAKAPLAAHGYDPVAFFTQNRAVLGNAAHSAVHNGAAYRFSSEANQRKFERNPEAYAPQYGGFCAFGVSVGAKFDGDPRLFRVVDGKLYFNLNPDIQQSWLKDVPGNIQKADGHWTKIRNTPPQDL